MGGWKNSTETQQAGHPSRSGPKVKNGNSAKDGAPAGEAQMRDNLEGDELDPENDVRRRSKKNFPSVLSCIGNRTKEGCDRGSEVETVHS